MDTPKKSTVNYNAFGAKAMKVRLDEMEMTVKHKAGEMPAEPAKHAMPRHKNTDVYGTDLRAMW